MCYKLRQLAHTDQEKLFSNLNTNTAEMGEVSSIIQLQCYLLNLCKCRQMHS